MLKRIKKKCPLHQYRNEPNYFKFEVPLYYFIWNKTAQITVLQLPTIIR